MLRPHLLLAAGLLLATSVACGSDVADRICGPCEYVVKRGDTLSKIASAFDVTVEQLLDWNRDIKKASLIYPKQVIKLREGCETAAESGPSVVELLCRRSEQESFLEAIEAAGLVPLLKNASFQGTLFVPTNTAFSDILKGMGGVSLQTLAKSEPDLLKQVVLYHIVANGTLWAGDLEVGMDLATLLAPEEGLVVLLPSDDAYTQLVTTTDQSVKVIKTDFRGGKAAVHVVNEVLLPAKSFGNPCTYTIRPGDSLWGLSQMFDRGYEALVELNPQVPDINALAPGDQIYLPCA